MAGNYIGTELYIKNKNSFRNSERERGICLFDQGGEIKATNNMRIIESERT